MTRLLPLSCAVRTACLLLATSLAGCGSIENMLSGDKVDYRTAGARTAQLEVPPDLTQLARDTRFAPQGGAVSATAFQSAASSPMAATSAAATVAPQAVGSLRIERAGSQRWLATSLPPEQLWPQLQAFWGERGFTLVVDQAEAGVMETEWAENRAKLPQDFVRNSIGRVLDALYSTGERDKFRTRVERGAAGSEIYISHRGMVEVYTNAQKDSTVWQPRPSDPQLEGELLSRLMIRLGAKEEQARAEVAAATPVAARARILQGQPGAGLQVDDGFDRAWRRVGLALDRSGFTVEDRDRAQGVYFVRYVDPARAGKDEPSFLSRLFSFGGSKEERNGPLRYRVLVKAEGQASSTVTVQNSQGNPEGSDAARRIVALLVEDLK